MSRFTFSAAYNLLLAFISLLFTACSSPSGNNKATKKDSMFALLPPEQTGVTFNNVLEEGLNTNVLMYEYFYNGGGVAAGDVNGDGLQDLYFSGNMVNNKLYLNKGGLRFEDITGQSGVAGRPGPWKTGVTMADVNGDGKLDIYVCYSGKLRAEKRINQLFINQGSDKGGIPHFAEQAAQYGLADSSFSTQAYFFDYDRDGDLDMLLLNHNPNSLPVLDAPSTAAELQQADPNIGIKLYRNDKKVFKNVTDDSGISSSSLTYGLGAGIADLNNDGWPDMYICDDYTVPDYLYINNKNGTFTDVKKTALGHTTHFGMGNDVGDINNDGLPDILSLDMLPEDNHRQKMLMAPDNYEKYDLMLASGFYYQYMRNMLQVNNGNGTFSEVGQLAGISNTDWSWAALLADYDNDGWKDMFITNGYTRDYTNMDFLKYMNDYIQNNSGDIRRQNVLDLVQKMTSSDVVNYMFKNNGNLTFSNVSDSWGFSLPSNSNGGVYADLDNDGALDLIVNNINKPAFIYHNLATKNSNKYLQIKLEGDGMNTQGIGAKVFVYAKGAVQYAEQMPARGYQSSVSPIVHFGMANNVLIDSLRIVWLSGKQQLLKEIKTNQLLTLEEKNATAPYHYHAPSNTLFTETKSPIIFQQTSNNINDFKRQPLMINPMSFAGPCMIKGDVNGDGLEDVFIGGEPGTAGAIFIQQKSGTFAAMAQPALDADKMSADADAAFFDANGDGFTDLYVASGGYHNFEPEDPLLQDRLYLNDGKGNFTKSTDALPKMLTSKGCVRVTDINGDNHPDIFVGSRVIPGNYPETPQSFLLINDGKGHFTDQIKTIAPVLQSAGMVSDAAWMDINGDNKEDLIVVGEWMPVSVFINANGKLQNETSNYFDKSYNGWWNKLLVHDVNGDGKPDLVIGNLGLNTQCKVSNKEPAEMYYKDFDDNGSVDPILCFYIQGKSYPYVTRDELLDQMSTMRTKYTNYADYADQTIQQVFSSDDLKDAGHLTANCLSTMYFEMGTNGKFISKPLPIQAQESPVFTITPLDYNSDGIEDLLLCGNINRARLRFGKYDANYGVLLKGNGKGSFEYIPQWQSGFNIWGDVRSVLSINNTLLFGINQAPLKAYQFKKQNDKNITAKAQQP
ncbi:VCBS repeat-containing protein [Ilyomonas limi]|nr:VCBS repeat-containing protein [Ilyomonas limi]